MMDLRAQTAGHKLSLGIALITLAFLCAAVMSAFSKAAADVPPLLVLFLQYGISFLVFVPFAVKAGPANLRTGHFGLQLFRSLAGSICQLLFFVSVRSIPLLDSVLLSNAAPLFIPLVVYVWFRKTVQPLVWVSLLIGLAGIVMIIKPGPQLFHKPASLIALVAGLFSALALVATNKLAETEPPVRILIYNFGFSTLLLIPFCIWAWKPLAWNSWLLLIGVGVFYALTQYLIIRAYRYASATELSPFNYTVVIFSGVLDWMFFGNVPDTIALFGTILICAGGILSIEAGPAEGHGHAFGHGHWELRWKLKRPRLTRG
ncbi:MAG: DMT family transporter [Acidobacteriaceae bacterium]|nr:DMT family transporter [Acidobacteriaceae bacterium]MBV9502388.1 DMT family transporter [Acidobacteriaceae bacterium]